MSDWADKAADRIGDEMELHSYDPCYIEELAAATIREEYAKSRPKWTPWPTRPGFWFCRTPIPAHMLNAPGYRMRMVKVIVHDDKGGLMEFDNYMGMDTLTEGCEWLGPLEPEGGE